jgi:hypothetical protein
MATHPIYSENFKYSDPEVFAQTTDRTYFVRSVTDPTGLCMWETGIEAPWVEGVVAYSGRFTSKETAISLSIKAYNLPPTAIA